MTDEEACILYGMFVKEMPKNYEKKCKYTFILMLLGIGIFLTRLSELRIFFNFHILPASVE